MTLAAPCIVPSRARDAVEVNTTYGCAHRSSKMNRSNQAARTDQERSDDRYMTESGLEMKHHVAGHLGSLQNQREIREGEGDDEHNPLKRFQKMDSDKDSQV